MAAVAVTGRRRHATISLNKSTRRRCMSKKKGYGSRRDEKGKGVKWRLVWFALV
jgi:hypothetical protein